MYNWLDLSRKQETQGFNSLVKIITEIIAEVYLTFVKMYNVIFLLNGRSKIQIQMNV